MLFIRIPREAFSDLNYPLYSAILVFFISNTEDYLNLKKI